MKTTAHKGIHFIIFFSRIFATRKCYRKRILLFASVFHRFPWEFYSGKSAVFGVIWTRNVLRWLIGVVKKSFPIYCNIGIRVIEQQFSLDFCGFWLHYYRFMILNLEKPKKKSPTILWTDLTASSRMYSFYKPNVIKRLTRSPNTIESLPKQPGQTS